MGGILYSPLRYTHEALRFLLILGKSASSAPPKRASRFLALVAMRVRMKRCTAR
jgi:hypothetical protein